MSNEVNVIRRFESLIRGAKKFKFDLKIAYAPGNYSQEQFCLYADETQSDQMSKELPFAVFDNLDQVSGFIKGLDVQDVVNICNRNKPRKLTKKVK